MKKFCETCGFLAPSQPVCLLTKRKVSPTSDFCSNHRKDVPHCHFCNNITLKPIIYKDIFICQNCYEAFGTCGACVKATACKFETDPSPTEKYVQAQVRQGNAIVMRTVQNPSRIAETCAKGCLCYNPEIGCLRQSEGKCCENYKEVPINETS